MGAVVCDGRASGDPLLPLKFKELGRRLAPHGHGPRQIPDQAQIETRQPGAECNGLSSLSSGPQLCRRRGLDASSPLPAMIQDAPSPLALSLQTESLGIRLAAIALEVDA